MIPQTQIGSLTLRISQSPAGGYVLHLNSVGQPDLSLTLHCRKISLGDERGNGHPLPESILDKNLTTKD